MRKNEAVVIRNRGGKLLEVKIICHESTKTNEKKFVTDNVVNGAMETKIIPNRLDNFISWVEKNGRMAELEKLIYFVAK